MKTKFTASTRVVLEALANLIAGNLPGFEKPKWGWKDVKIEIPSEPEFDFIHETVEEPDGHGGLIQFSYPTELVVKKRHIAFWLTNEFHLATFYLEKASENENWEVVLIATGVDPQYGRGDKQPVSAINS